MKAARPGRPQRRLSRIPGLVALRHFCFGFPDGLIGAPFAECSAGDAAGISIEVELSRRGLQSLRDDVLHGDPVVAHVIYSRDWADRCAVVLRH